MSDSIDTLRQENQRLIALLEKHGIHWRESDRPDHSATDTPDTSLSTDEKVRLFQSLFKGRTDVYAQRWENRTKEQSGYSPACANEWRAGICEKPRIKCSQCRHRQLIPLSDQILYDHLAGTLTAGIYPLLIDNTCHILAADFDKADWQNDIKAFAASCHELGVPVALEISRSGQGGHAWIFFDRAVPARDARQLGTVLISHTCAQRHQLDLSSYDRLFPNQDLLPKGGFGNLIALPLQKAPRTQGHSVFVDAQLNVIDDQWAYLATLERMRANDISTTILTAAGNGHPLDVAFIDEEDVKTPWKRTHSEPLAPEDIPDTLELRLVDKLYIEKDKLPPRFLNRLVRMAAFQNPEFYKAQKLRLPVWDKPRVIGCADNYPRHVALPRGCLEPVQQLLNTLSVKQTLIDERHSGTPITTDFTGMLHHEQTEAVNAMLAHDIGILSAPTAFGKTVAAAAIIAARKTNTLILVHRSQLQAQWLERLSTFLDLPAQSIGQFGGGKKKLTGIIDIALLQSLSRHGTVNELVEHYGQVIIDECHHLGAQSFESVLKQVKAQYILGLSATPVRRDGQQPIIYMQCGPIRHQAKKASHSALTMTVAPLYRDQPIAVPHDAGIQEIFRAVSTDPHRTETIAATARDYYARGHKVLILSERTDHVEALHQALKDTVSPFILHGRIRKKQRTQTLTSLNALEPDTPRVLIATGKLIGEGFDHAALDVLVLAMPISWKGTLQQYAGRLHRDHQGKEVVTIVDTVDLGHPALVRMWERRQRGYQSMGYQLRDEDNPPLQQLSLQAC